MTAPDFPEDPVSRFEQIYGLLNQDRGWWGDASSLRFSAMTAVICAGSPGEVATAIRATAEDIKSRVGWFGSLRSPLRFIVSALLVLNGDLPAAFLDEVERVGTRFRALNLRRGGIYETMAVLILRLRRDLEPIPVEALYRFQALYEEMKRHHWWLTGPDDFPACAILVGEEGSPEEIGKSIEEVYQALSSSGLSTGDPLQTAANLLYLAHLRPRDAARRFRDLAEGFRESGVSIWQSDYDELAILTFLEQPAPEIVRRVVGLRSRMEQLSPRPGRLLTFNLAASLAFLELVQVDRDLKAITGAKALLDMQAIINAQQAAAAAAASSAATTAS